MDSNNKNILITGGSGFVGEKLCSFFLKKNYKVFSIDIKNPNFLLKKNKNFIFYKSDISKEKNIKKIYLNIKKKYFINTLINNAAIDAVPSLGKKKDISENEFIDMLKVNILGNYFLIKYFGEQMSKQGQGSIINIGSDLSYLAPDQRIYQKDYPGYIKPVTYSISKHALLGMTKYYASLFANNNVRVNMISPGPINKNQSLNLKKNIRNKIPFKRLAKIDDLLGILFFLSDNIKSSYITGQNIFIDGGKTAI